MVIDITPSRAQGLPRVGRPSNFHPLVITVPLVTETQINPELNGKRGRITEK